MSYGCIIVLARQIRTRRRTHNAATQTGQLYGRVEIEIKNKTNHNEDIERLCPATHCLAFKTTKSDRRRREIAMRVNANN